MGFYPSCLTCGLFFAFTNGEFLIIDTESSKQPLTKFWTGTGLSPSRTSQRSVVEYLLSQDEKVNLAFISSLPQGSISHVRIHWLLDLITVRGEVFDFSVLDQLVDYIVFLELKPRFEMMGVPVNSTPESMTRGFWFKICNELAKHFIEKYSINEVKSWKFETWNEPDLKMYNVVNFDLNDYLNYVDGCLGGLRNASEELKLGGPAGLFKNHHPLCWGFLNHCNASLNRCHINYISFHKKGPPMDLVTDTARVRFMINDVYPHLSQLPIVNDESDLLSGWWKSEEWRGDVRYAAAICRVIFLFLNQKSELNLEAISNDNGFMSYRPNHFTQRTLLARFVYKEKSQFIKKPVYVATGLLGLLQSYRIDRIQLNTTIKGLFAIPTTNEIGNNFTTVSILVVYCGDSFEENSTSVQLNVQISVPDNWSSRELPLYSVLMLSNQLPHPKQVWESYGKPEFPSSDELEAMRLSEGPHLIERGHFSKVFNTTLELSEPSIAFIKLCSKTSLAPGKVNMLRAVSITTNEIILFWKDDFVQSNCIKTYEIEFSRGSGFFRINKKDTVMCSFQYANYSGKDENTIHGHYRVAAVDLWDRKGSYSTIHYP